MQINIKYTVKYRRIFELFEEECKFQKRETSNIFGHSSPNFPYPVTEG